MSSVEAKPNFRQLGFKAAGLHLANANNLASCLESCVVEYTRHRTASANILQQQIEDTKQECGELKKEIQSSNSQRIPALRAREQEIQKEFSSALNDPKSAPTNQGFSFSGFVIGLAILSMLTVFLFVFYSSTIHTSFIATVDEVIEDMQNGGNNTKLLIRSVFDPQAVTKAIAEGLAASLLVLLGPAIFIGMGFLYHLYSQQAQQRSMVFLKLIGLLLIIFLADSIIAYKIAEFIHEVKLITGIVREPWRPGMIWTDVNFYLVILAGFATYLIWGSLLQYVLDQIQKRPSGSNIRRWYNSQLQEIKRQISTEESERERKQGQLDDKMRKLQGLEKESVTGFVNLTELRSALGAFVGGWKQFITGLFSDEPGNTEANRLLSSTDSSYQEFLGTLNGRFVTHHDKEQR